MIAPNMATMLAYVFTDAAVAPDVLDKALREACEQSFNAITVDSDTSTSDSLMVFATGASGDTINIGWTGPQSGQLAAFGAIGVSYLYLAAQHLGLRGELGRRFAR